MIDRQAVILANIRLVMLRALGAEDNETLNDTILQMELERFGFARSRDFIRNQLSWLQKEVGAVRINVQGTATIATLTDVGRDHLMRRSVLEGVQKPSSALGD